MSRPRLKSHARPLLRAPGTVQLGLAPPAGAVLEGLSEAEVRWLERLDGTTGHTLLYAEAAAAGIPPQRVEALLDTLRDLDLLVEQPTDRACLSSLGAARRAGIGRVETGAAALDALELDLRAAGRSVDTGRSGATTRSGAGVGGPDRP